MAILKYFPPQIEIRDNRAMDKGYYEAACENCGTLFYPKRSNAKYCTSKCSLIYHRKNKVAILVAGGTIKSSKSTREIINEIKEKLKAARETPEKTIDKIIVSGGAEKVSDYFKKFGLKGYVFHLLRCQEINNIVVPCWEHDAEANPDKFKPLDKYRVMRISENKYWLKRK